MGFFDFLRPKPARSLSRDRVEDDLDEPRCAHYTLAHVALREFALRRPLDFIEILATPEARRLLSYLLERVSDSCEGSGSGPDFDVDDLKVHTARVGDYPCAIVEMPRPRAMAEAYFVAAVLNIKLDEESPGPADPTLRYFTLEKGLSLDGSHRTVLCEWTADGTHSNYGDGPPPQLESFVPALEKMVSGG